MNTNEHECYLKQTKNSTDKTQLFITVTRYHSYVQATTVAFNFIPFKTYLNIYHFAFITTHDALNDITNPSIIWVLLFKTPGFDSTYCKPAVFSLQISMWLVWCKLCGVHTQAFTPACEWAKNQASSICKHYSDKHCVVLKDLDKQFLVLKKCRNKFDCLGHKYDRFIRELTPSLNVQLD